MLQFYKDAALTLPVTQGSPKEILLPLKGGVRTTSLWLGDAYTATFTAQAATGATSVTLDQTSEFPASGSATYGNTTITYTGKTSTSLTGIPANGAGSIPDTISIGTKIFPVKSYAASGNVSIVPSGSDLGQGIKVSVKRPNQSSYNFPGTPAIYTETEVTTGVANAIQVDLQVSMLEGEQRVFNTWNLRAIPLTWGGNSYTATAYGWALRRDQSLQQKIRVLPLNRQVSDNLPGFVVGEHRWRETPNAVSLVPTVWDPDVDRIGREKFIAGIGHGLDLEPVSLEESQDSLFIRVRHGAYFTGVNRYYLPSVYHLEFLPCSTVAPYDLADSPRETIPLFVGTWRLDGQGFYETDEEYRYQAGEFDDQGGLQYRVDRAGKKLYLNQPLIGRVLYLGTVSGEAVDYFDCSVYPIDRVKRIFIDRGKGVDALVAANYSFDREQGTVQVTSPTGIGPSIPNSLAGESVFMEYEPAVAVLYEYGAEDTRQVTEVDINPAFSGLSGGYFFLQHRRLKPDVLELSADKPLISIPPTFDTIIGLTAYGPVYFEDDYALLIARAYSKVPGEVVPNARLRVIVDPDNFTGLINYKDPLSETVEVVTGGDGVANLIYTPTPGFGVWLPNAAATGNDGGKATTTVTDDTLVLSEAVPISQIRNDKEGWLVTLYQVFDDNPLFGLTGGDPTLGEIPFTTAGTPGLIDYKTNGARGPWKVGETIVRPIQALDSAGRNYTDGLFSGSVKKLVYSTALPTNANTAAYFVSYLQRVTIQLALVSSNLESNTILLQMEDPGLIYENPWLILDDDIQGRLNQYRLGWARTVPSSPNRSLL